MGSRWILLRRDAPGNVQLISRRQSIAPEERGFGAGTERVSRGEPRPVSPAGAGGEW